MKESSVSELPKTLLGKSCLNIIRDFKFSCQYKPCQQVFLLLKEAQVSTGSFQSQHERHRKTIIIIGFFFTIPRSTN